MYIILNVQQDFGIKIREHRFSFAPSRWSVSKKPGQYYSYNTLAPIYSTAFYSREFLMERCPDELLRNNNKNVKENASK